MSNEQSNEASLANRKVSFVIPCYNSEKTISSVIEEIVSCVRGGDQYEIICVNDCSSDNVQAVLENEAANNSRVKVIQLSINGGQHNALMAGFNYVTGDIVVCLDDDGQTPACDSYRLIDALDDDHDVIYARYAQKKHGLVRNLGSKFNKWTGEIMIGMPKDVFESSFFACKRFIIDEVIKYKNPYSFIQGLILRTTRKLGNVDVEHRDRLEGSSGYSMAKLIGLWLNGFTSFSVKPLRVSAIVGFVLAFLGFIFGIIVVIRKIVDPSIAAGYSSLMAVILVVGGLLMIMAGMLGEYIGRIYISLNNSPQYVIRKTVNIEEATRAHSKEGNGHDDNPVS